MVNTVHGKNFIWRLLLFNIFLCDHFLFTNDVDIASYADDNSSYATSSKTNLAIKRLKQCPDTLFTWFQNNRMKPSADKCHFSVSSKVCQINNVGGHPLSTYAKFSENVTFLTPLRYIETSPLISQGVRNVSFSENFAYVLN